MMACRGVKVYIHTFLTSTLDGDERASCPQALYDRRKGAQISVRQNTNRTNTNFVVTNRIKKCARVAQEKYFSPLLQIETRPLNSQVFRHVAG
jgi:hypothetical protein